MAARFLRSIFCSSGLLGSSGPLVPLFCWVLLAASGPVILWCPLVWCSGPLVVRDLLFGFEMVFVGKFVVLFIVLLLNLRFVVVVVVVVV